MRTPAHTGIPHSAKIKVNIAVTTSARITWPAIIFFLLGFALRLGASEKTNEKMFPIALRFVLAATGIFFALWFLSHPVS
jgi:hypothetical protein